MSLHNYKYKIEGKNKEAKVIIKITFNLVVNIYDKNIARVN